MCLLQFVKSDALAVMILRSWSFSIGRVSPRPFEFLQSDSLRAIPLPAVRVRTVILQHTTK
jgi:hypothetical protein